MSSSANDLYKQLTRVANNLIEELGRPVSLREALLQLIDSMKLDPGDFSWSWRINQTRSKEAGEDKSGKRKRPDSSPYLSSRKSRMVQKGGLVELVKAGNAMTGDNAEFEIERREQRTNRKDPKLTES